MVGPTASSTNDVGRHWHQHRHPVLLATGLPRLWRKEWPVVVIMVLDEVRLRRRRAAQRLGAVRRAGRNLTMWCRMGTVCCVAAWSRFGTAWVSGVRSNHSISGICRIPKMFDAT